MGYRCHHVGNLIARLRAIPRCHLCEAKFAERVVDAESKVVVAQFESAEGIPSRIPTALVGLVLATVGAKVGMGRAQPPFLRSFPAGAGNSRNQVEGAHVASSGSVPGDAG